MENKEITNEVVMQVDDITSQEKVSPRTIARALALAVALMNAILMMLGKTPLDLDESTIYDAVSVMAIIGTAVWSWWKNNPVTKKEREIQARKRAAAEDGDGSDSQEVSDEI